MIVVFWGTYDLSKPRTRILLRGLREAGVEVREIHRDVWRGAADKSLLSPGQALAAALRWLAAYPALVLRYLRAPAHDVVMVGYLGQLDVLVIWPWARLRGVPVVWDAFLSLYDTVVGDRRLLGRRHPLAWLLYLWEALACRAARRVVLDTRAHADFFRRRFRLPAQKVAVAWVGAETDLFPARPPTAAPAPSPAATRVLFYGQLIPLHGVETLLQAALELADEPFDWLLVGSGQQELVVEHFLQEHPLPRLRRLAWVPYSELHRHIHRAHVCLGIFGTSGKAARVIPNKVFQVMACGVPLVTRDSPAIRELVGDGVPGLTLIPAGDPAALAAALRQVAAARGQGEDRGEAPDGFGGLRRRIEPAAVGRALAAVLEAAVAEGRP